MFGYLLVAYIWLVDLLHTTLLQFIGCILDNMCRRYIYFRLLHKIYDPSTDLSEKVKKKILSNWIQPKNESILL